MANAQGWFSGRSAFRLDLDVWEQSTDTGANTSQVRRRLTITNTGSYRSYSNAGGQTWSISVDGQNASGTFTFDLSGGAVKTLIDDTITVGHNADGSKTVGFSASVNADVIGNASASGSVGLTVIPRATQPNQPSATDAGANMVIGLPRASSGFTHNIRAVFGSYDQWIASGVGVSYTWAVPMELLTRIPGSASGGGTLYVDTYNGGTLIGTKSVGFTVTAGAGIVPTFDTITHAEAVSAVGTTVGAYVQLLSKLQLAITSAAGVYGSTITGYRIEVAGQAITSQSGTTPNVLAAAGAAVAIVGTVTDSRGRTATKTVTVNVLAYSPPLINTLTVQRSTSAGTVDLNAGTYAKVTLDAAASSLINGTEKNQLRFKVETRATGATDWTDQGTYGTGVAFNSAQVVGSGGISIASSYDVRVTVLDRFNQALAQRAIATAQVPLDIAANGIGVGKMWEQGALDVFGNTFLKGALAVDGAASATVISEGGMLLPAKYARADWAIKAGPSTYVSPYWLTWTKGVDSGGSLDAHTRNDAIVIGAAGVYEVIYRQRGAAAGGYIGVGLSGSRNDLQAIEDAGNGMWFHDHFPGANMYATSGFIGPLPAGALITGGPVDSSQSDQRGAAGYLGHLVVRRII